MSSEDLDHASQLLALHLSEAVSHFGPEALDVIDLPPLTGRDVEPAQLRAVAALFWAMEVDAAGVIEFVEALAEGTRLGRFEFDLGHAQSRLYEWHRRRGERLTLPERLALYDRLFGVEEAREGLAALVAVLCQIDVQPLRAPPPMARVNVIAQQLATTLSSRSAGITAFAAREIVDSIREALEILHSPDLLAVFGRRSTHDVLASAGAVVVGRPLDPGTHFERARAGQQILSWLADVALQLEAGQVSVAPTDPVVHAANAWQALGPGAAVVAPESSLALEATRSAQP